MTLHHHGRGAEDTTAGRRSGQEVNMSWTVRAKTTHRLGMRKHESLWSVMFLMFRELFLICKKVLGIRVRWLLESKATALTVAPSRIITVFVRLLHLFPVCHSHFNSPFVSLSLSHTQCETPQLKTGSCSHPTAHSASTHAPTPPHPAPTTTAVNGKTRVTYRR